jgi:inhibitor of KinA sporulation pathway (predicted exonuclease)
VTIGPGQSSDHLQVPGTLTYINMLLTLWAHSYLREPDTVLQPLQLDTFRRLFTDMWQPEVDSPTIKTEVKQNFLRWLARRSGRAESALTIELGAALDELFHALESELGHVESRHLDPRFIQLFIIAGPGPRP